MSVYDVRAYGGMVADKDRMEAYLDALQRVVSKTTTVAEIGTGSGVMALAAARLGAKHVYAIEEATIAQLAREIVSLNGCAERVSIHQESSMETTLPETVDIIVSDMRGVLPLFSNHLESIIDARRRLLTPGGRLIPEMDTIWAVPVHAPSFYERCIKGWSTDEYGFDLSPGRRFAINHWLRGPVPRDVVIHEPACWAELRYHEIDTFDVRGSCRWRFDGAGPCNGFAVWFDAHLVDEIGFSNAPGTDLVYKNAFFPLEQPVEIKKGDRLDLDLDARFASDDYIWTWRTRLVDADGTPKHQFKQSTFRAKVLDPREMRKRNPQATPELNLDGRTTRDILVMINDGLDLGTVAKNVLEQYPDRFSGNKRALDYVLDLAQRFTD